MNSQFNMMVEAQKFADISHKYSESKIKTDKDKYQIQIKNLIKETAIMVETYFKTVFIQKKSGFTVGKKGTMMIVPNMGKIINSIVNKTALNPSKMVRYTTESKKEKNGAMFLLDYSGSMWFESGDSTFNSVQRIHMQNFIVLTTTHMLQKMNKTKVTIIPFGFSPIVFESNNIIDEDIDLFLVNKEWGSIATRGNLHGVPKKIRALNKDFNKHYDWCCDIYPNKAIKLSLDIMKKSEIKKYAYMFFTDGGMQRIGETGNDRKVFMERMITTINQNTDTALFNFVFIKSQDYLIQSILDNMKQKYDIFDTVKSVNSAFEVLSNSIIDLFNKVKM